MRQSLNLRRLIDDGSKDLVVQLDDLKFRRCFFQLESLNFRTKFLNLLVPFLIGSTAGGCGFTGSSSGFLLSVAGPPAVAGEPSALITRAGFRCTRRSRSFRATSARLWAWTHTAINRITIKALMIGCYSFCLHERFHHASCMQLQVFPKNPQSRCDLYHQHR